MKGMCSLEAARIQDGGHIRGARRVGAFPFFTFFLIFNSNVSVNVSVYVCVYVPVIVLFYNLLIQLAGCNL